MKLEIKHIAPYLPYKLKYILYGITTNSVHHVSFAMAEDIVDSINKDDMIRKLLLRPMSDLYKPLENGEVPIVELAKIAFRGNGYTFFKVKGKEVLFRSESATLIFRFYDETIRFSDQRNLLEMLQYLFEHHFDVFSLIDNDLAIDINSIKE